jgi:hypothetical protein
MKRNKGIACLLILLIFWGCKKYPENILLIVPPEMVLKQLSGAKLKIFTVNGHDSTIVLERKWGKVKDRIFVYNPYLAPRSSSFYSNYTWGSNIVRRIDLYDNQKMLEGDSPFNIYRIERWKIVKLSSRELKLETNKNGVIYEMQFSK